MTRRLIVPAEGPVVGTPPPGACCSSWPRQKRIYAAADIPCYWIVNLIDGQVEVHTQPSGPSDQADYAAQQVYRRGDRIPVVLEGAEVGTIVVDDLLP